MTTGVWIISTIDVRSPCCLFSPSVLYKVILSAYQILLHKYDILVCQNDVALRQQCRVSSQLITHASSRRPGASLDGQASSGEQVLGLNCDAALTPVYLVSPRFLPHAPSIVSASAQRVISSFQEHLKRNFLLWRLTDL